MSDDFTTDQAEREASGAHPYGRYLEEFEVGAIYRPEIERVAHCFESRMAERFDWVVHLDETTAVRPLD